MNHHLLQQERVMLSRGYYTYYSEDDPQVFGIIVSNGFEHLLGTGFVLPYTLERFDTLDEAKQRLIEIVGISAGKVLERYSGSIAQIMEFDSMIGGSLADSGVQGSDRYYG